jgi:hypothetical protein
VRVSTRFLACTAVWHAFHLPCKAAGLQASNSDTERPRPSRTRCRRRGGYFELVNFPSDVRDQLYKLSSISLCPNLSGQICMALIMNPPAAGDPSYEQYTRERDDILAVRCSAPPVLLGGRRCLDSQACLRMNAALTGHRGIRPQPHCSP